MKALLLSLLSTISVVLGLVGLGVLGWGFWRMRRAFRSRAWPTVQGTLVSSTTASREAPPLPSRDGDAAASRPPRTLYRPEVAYTYTVGGRSYTGTQLGMDAVEVSSERHAQAHAARYVPGAPVTVFHDPEDPSRAVLEPGVGAASWAIPAVGAVFLVVTGALYLFIRWYSGR